MNLRHSDDEESAPTAEWRRSTPVEVEKPVASPREESKRRKSQRISGGHGSVWPWIAGTVLAAAVLVPAGVSFFMYDDDFSASNDLPRAAAAYRATGLPWTASEVDAAVPEDRNAAPLLDLAAKQIKGTEKETNNIGEFMHLDDEHLAAAQELAELMDPALATAAEALKRPYASWKHDWRLGPMTTFPEFSFMEPLVRGFVLRAELKGRKGDIDGAVEDLRNARKLASLQGQGPLLMAMLGQIGEDGTAMDGIQRVAADFPNDMGALGKLREVAEMSVAPPDFNHAMGGEAFNQVQIGRNPVFQSQEMLKGSASMPQIDPNSLISDGLPSDLGARATLDRILEAWIEYARFAKSHPNDPMELSRKLEEIANEISHKTSTSYGVPKLIFPVFEQSGIAATRLEAIQRATDALLKAMIEHARTGRYPSSIDAIPGNWIDPFTGQPMHVRATPANGGFRVYSDGPSKVDHGGVASWDLKQGTDQDKVDVVASYPPRPR